METFDALAGPSRQMSVSAQMQALSVSRQITKRKIQSVDFVQGLRVERSPLMGLYANDCTFNSNTVAESRFEIVNPSRLKCQPKSWQRDLPAG